MLTVGEKFPNFKLNAVVSLDKGKEFQEITESTHRGKWQVIFSGRWISRSSARRRSPSSASTTKTSPTATRRSWARARHAFRSPGVAQQPP